MIGSRQFIFLTSLIFLNIYVRGHDSAYTIVLSEDSSIDHIKAHIHDALVNDAPREIHITSLTAKTLIVPQGAVWDLTRLSAQSSIRFSGNAHLVLQSGARIRGNGLKMKFTERSGMRIQGS